MRQRFTNLLACSLLASLATGCASFSSNEPASPSLKGERIPLNRGERDEVSRARNFEKPQAQSTPQEVKPATSSYPLTTRYIYGVSTPLVVCGVMHICSIELQPGERISAGSPRAGDKDRWITSVLSAGQGASEAAHVTVMPLESNIETSMIVMTNRRAYQIQLRSSRGDSMLRTTFIYPDELAARWNATQQDK